MKKTAHGVLALFILNLLFWGYNWVPLRLMVMDG